MLKSKLKNIDTFSILRILAAVLIGYAIVSIIIFIVADSPLQSLERFILGPFSSRRNFFNILETMVPLVFTALAINVMQKCGMFNFIADGSFFMGAVTATAIAILVPMPNILHQTVLLVAAAIVGGLIGSIPAILKLKTGASETVMSIMLNSVFFFFGRYIIVNFLLDKTASFASKPFLKTARLGRMVEGTSLHYGFIIMMVVVVLVVILMEKTTFGYKLRLIGNNKKFANQAGINVTRAILISQVIGGMIAGLGGAVEMVGIYNRFLWDAPVTYVWDGILANLMAFANPRYIILSTFFLSYIRVGSDIMSRSTNIDNEISAILQGIIILLVASERFLYFIKKRRDNKEALRLEEVK